MKRTFIYVACGLLISLSLPACGGGGSSSGSTTNKLTIVGAGS